MDPVEEMRLAIVAQDNDRCKTLIGPVWNERDLLRSQLAALQERLEESHPSAAQPRPEEAR
jgi:uncharacterized coiled-coil protein SlyX